MSNTKLVFFSFGILEQGGGLENYIIETAHELSARNADLDITIVTATPAITEKLQHVYTVYYMSKQDTKAIYREDYDNIIKRLGRAKYVRVGSIKALKEVLRSADVIYAKNEILELGILRSIGMKKLPPVLVGIHTAIHYPDVATASAKVHNAIYMGKPYSWLLKHAALVVTNNAEDAQLLKDRLNVKNARPIHHPFTIPPFKQVRHDTSEIRMVFVGRLTQQKGIELLIDIVKKLPESLPEGVQPKLKIAGSGDVAIDKRVHELEAAYPWVEYLGHVQNDTVQELYEWTDLTLITSRYETLNKVAVETALSGKVVLSTDISGPREAIDHGMTGFLLPLQAEAFCAKIAELAELKHHDPEVFYTIGQAAYDKIKRDFSADEVYPLFYQAIIDLKHEAAA